MQKLIPLFFTISLFFTLQSHAQNMVPNPSFESYTSCPTGAQQWAGKVVSWYNPTGSTPDYFNSCGASMVNVPSNWCGNQAARTGQAYGRCLDYGYQAGYGEYIQTQLTSPMTAGVTYDITYYVSMCDNQNYAHTGPELYVSMSQITQGGTSRFPYTPHVKNPSIISNKSGWTQVSGSYTAVGGEQWITMGLFTPDASLSWSNVGGGSWNSSSYWMEDVSVVPATVLGPELSGFAAEASKNQVNLNWQLASPMEFKQFSIERSLDGRGFSSIGTIEADETNKNAVAFNFTDPAPVPGENHYRIRVIDVDGEAALSSVESVYLTGTGLEIVSIGPNPVVGPELGVNVRTDETLSLTLEIFDVTGRVITKEQKTAQFGQSLITMDVNALEAGVYWLRIRDSKGNVVATEKFVK